MACEQSCSFVKVEHEEAQQDVYRGEHSLNNPVKEEEELLIPDVFIGTNNLCSATQGEKLIKCTLCNYRCNHELILGCHILRHARKKLFFCSECDYRTALKTNFDMHILSHKGLKPFKCEMCSFESARSSGLKRHIVRHTKTPVFACTLCDFTTLYKGSLKDHAWRHTDQKPFMCTECSYSCIRKKSFIAHVAKHSGEKMSRRRRQFCNLCKRTFLHFQTHLRRSHREEVFKCFHCTYYAVDIDILAKHIKKHIKKSNQDKE